MTAKGVGCDALLAAFMSYTKRHPSAPGFYWVRRVGTRDNRIAEVIPCDVLDKRPKGSLKLSFTQCEEATQLDGYEYDGPIPPPYDPDDDVFEPIIG